MVELTLQQLVEAIDGRGPVTAASGAPDTQLRGVCIDSRAAAPGQIFFAIVGHRLDGHAFVAQAARAKVGVLVLQRPPSASEQQQVPFVEVADTTIALGKLAQAWRREVDPTVVGITGSVGKTTTKELLQQILRLHGPTQHNQGNLNNHIGVPLTLLQLERTTEFSVVEMGMSAAGEIAYLSRLAEPSLGCITAIAPVHLEQLGSLEAVAGAKAELLVGLSADAPLVLPADEPLLEPHLRQLPRERRVVFGESSASDVRIVSVEARGASATHVELSYRDIRINADLPLPGVHNARNAAAAAAIALTLGVDSELIAAGLEATPELGHRARVVPLGDWQLLDDCYNASPLAMKVALQMLADVAGQRPRVAVLGKMLELGAHAAALHREVGGFAARLGLTLLVVVGPEAEPIARGAREAGLDEQRIVVVDGPEQAAEQLRRRAPPDSCILVKASRGARLEQVVDALERPPA